jgi:hypothetical protein
MDYNGRSDSVGGRSQNTHYPSGSHQVSVLFTYQLHGLLCSQTPFSPSSAGNGSYRPLDSIHVEVTSRPSTSLPSTQNYSVSPTAAQAVVYQSPSPGPSFHTTPYANAGEFPYPTPHPPLSHRNPQQMPSHVHFPYMQVSPMIGGPTTNDFRGSYNIHASHGFPIQHNTQVSVIPIRPEKNPFTILPGCHLGGTRITG